MERFSSTRCNGFSFTEFALAIALLISILLPSISWHNSFSSSKKNETDTIEMILLCQSKLGKALEIPFGNIPPGTYGGRTRQSFVVKSQNNVNLQVGLEEINGLTVEVTLQVEDLPGTFSIPVCDTAKKLEHPLNPENWSWTTKVIPYKDIYQKFTITLRWYDEFPETERSYSLTANKARLRE